MSHKMRITPVEMTLDQAISFYHALDSEGRKAFFEMLTTEETKAIEQGLFEINDKVVVKTHTGQECNGTVVSLLDKVGYYRVAYIVHNQVTVGNIHHSRVHLGQIDTE